MKLIADPRFYYDIRCVRIQRQVSDQQYQFFTKFLKPLSESLGFWIIYEVDDVIKYEDIPAYNLGRHAFQSETFFANVKNILSQCDFLTVTTPVLKKYYVDNYGIDDHKVLVIPNYLPRWWIGEAYNVDIIRKRATDNWKKPRIGFPMSSSHFDLNNTGNKDDFSDVADFVRSTVNKYQWVIIGHAPKVIEDLIKDGKVEVIPGSDLLNYPRELVMRNLQAIVAPLQNNIFNVCKSNIKLLEGWSLGIPVIAQDLPCYSPYTDMLFHDNASLQEQLDKLFRDIPKYMKIVKQNRHIVDYGDKNAPNGWWIEKNLHPWYNLFTLPQKTLRYDLTRLQTVVQPTETINLDLT